MTIQERVARVLESYAPYDNKGAARDTCAVVAAWLRKRRAYYQEYNLCTASERAMLGMVADELDPPKPAVKEGKR